MGLELVESPVRQNSLAIGQATLEDVAQEPSLRPKSLDEYIGQAKIVNNLKIFLKAALRRSEALDHCLFFGPPGLGKTSLAVIISNELGASLKTVHAPSVEKGGDLAAILTNLEEGDVLFIDEIHRLRPQIEEILYPAMEDYTLDIMIGQGTAARSIKIDLPKFTLVGATTRAGLISAPLRGRFGIVNHLDFYSRKDLEIIVHRSSEILGIEIEATGASEIARRGRRVSRTVSFAACAITPRFWATGASPARSRRKRSTRWRSIVSVWMKLTASFCFRLSKNSTAVRSASARSRLRSAKTANRSRKLSSRT
jgi:Holliday junction resolvasome RuvABC ATP-dependent DNA helicase subunit